MADAEFFRRQAEQCLRLSRTSYDMETSRQLRMMAAEFFEKADDYETQEDYFPRARNTDAKGGGMDRD